MVRVYLEQVGDKKTRTAKHPYRHISPHHHNSITTIYLQNTSKLYRKILGLEYLYFGRIATKSWHKLTFLVVVIGGGNVLRCEFFCHPLARGR